MAAVNILPLDPVFLKALKLLRSKNKDSLEQLKEMLDEAIANKKSKPKSSSSLEASSSLSKAIKMDTEKKREAEKRNLEKVKGELLDLTTETKRIKVDSGDVRKNPDIKHTSRDAKDVPQKEPDPSQYESIKKERQSSDISDIGVQQSGDGIIDADEFALGLGISCFLCRLFDVTTGNQLIECQECHNLYHQECHKPRVSDEEVNDPRSVWYCSQCQKSLTKMMIKPTKPKSTVPSTVPKEQDPLGKPRKSPPTTNPFQFRRSEPKPTSTKESNGASAAKPMSGFESLAANLSGRSLLESQPTKAKIDQLKQISWSKVDAGKPTKNTNTNLSVSSDSIKDKSKQSGASSKTNWSGSVAMAINAEKKLQLVKKRAANTKVTDKKHYK